MGLRFIKRTWLLKDVGSDYSDDNDEIPEVLQTDHELEEANIVGDEPIPEEIDMEKSESEEEKDEALRERFIQRDNKHSLLCH